jgi:hypothetical protein
VNYKNLIRNKMEQKFIITWSQREIQELLDNGWRIVSVTAVHDGGKVAVVLERMKKLKNYDNK